jgi:arylsulfatase A-like enzyme
MERPNILVILSDQMKATASHLYGNPFCETPSLARLAGEGVLFRHAFTPHPLCVPARVSLWTGQWPHSTGARRNETWMPAGANHAFRLWHDEGYRCGLIGKNHCFDRAEDLALFDVWCETSHGGLPADPATRGMDWVRPLDEIMEAHSVRRNMPRISPRFSYAHTDFPLENYSTGLIAGQTVEFLRRFGDDPFALWVSIPDPHEPYEAPRRYAELYPPDVIQLPPWREDEFRGDEVPERNKVLYNILGMEDDPTEDIYGVLAAYYGMVRFLDDGVGQILDALEELGLRENTIVVFAADHGDFSGEHGMTCKGGVFYDALTRIPMIVSWPGHIPEGSIDESMVNLVDVAPTLLQLQGHDLLPSMHGRPLPTVTDAAPRDATFSEYGAGGPAFTLNDLRQLEQAFGRQALMRSLRWREAEGRRKMVRTARWKYVHGPMGDKDELYDLENDPWELRNVVEEPAHAVVLAEMQLRLADWSICTEDARPVPLPEPAYYNLGD